MVTLPSRSDAALVVRYAGIDHVVPPWESLAFGRNPGVVSRSLKLDQRNPDPALSRYTGAFRHAAGIWNLYNGSARLDLRLSIVGGLAAELQPGSPSIPLPADAHGVVTIRTARRYQLEFRTPRWEANLTFDDGEVSTTTHTVDLRDVFRLSDLEFAVVVGLCESRIRDADRGHWSTATNAEIGTLPGVVARADGTNMEKIVEKALERAIEKVDRKLGDRTFADARGHLRRQVFAEWAVAINLVTGEHLRWLGAPTRPAAGDQSPGSDGSSPSPSRS